MTSAPLPATEDPATTASGASGQVPCPVLWVTIAGYAAADVVTQAAWRDDLTRRAEQALAAVPAEQRIVLDVEAGLAVCFLAQPVLAAEVAAWLLDGAGVDGTPAFRIGLALGPVALIPARGDSLPRLVGDGVVVAERMNEFAEAGQMKASRPFVEAAAAGGPARGKVFRPESPRTDAQLRSHEVFGLDPAQVPLLKRPVPGTVALSSPHALWSSPKVAVAAAAFSVLALAAAVVRTDAPPPPSAGTVRPEIAAAPVPVADTPLRVDAPASPVAPAPSAEPSNGEAPRPAPAAAPAAPSAPPVPPRESPRRTEPVAAKRASVVLAVSPWGEVFVNGRAVGVSPPLTQVEVPPGRVAIEVRNAGSEPHAETFTLQPGERVQLRHKF